MKIASWNVNSLNVRLAHVCQWLELARPDVLALQETKLEDRSFPDTVFAEHGYRSVFAGQKAYNGVALLARTCLDAVHIGLPNDSDPQQRVIAATVAGRRFINVYVVNGQALDSDKFRYKMRWLQALETWLASELETYAQLVVLGDFNIAPEPRDVYDPTVWNDAHLLTSLAERAALQRVLALGMHDAFRLHHEAAGQYSWWDYRAAAFPRGRGLRIDLTLVSDALRPLVVDAGIDPTPRSWERPSDHAPIWVTLRDG